MPCRSTTADDRLAAAVAIAATIRPHPRTSMPGNAIACRSRGRIRSVLSEESPKEE
jgi:hypothetical protein